MNAACNPHRCRRTIRNLVQWLVLSAGISLPLHICAAASTSSGQAPVTADVASNPAGKWQSSAFGGADTLTLSLRAENAVKGWMKTYVPVLTIQCSKGKPAVYIETGMPLEVTQVDKQHIRIRIDDKPPYPQRWREMGNATVFAAPRDAEALIRQLLEARKFVFEFIPFSSPPAQAEFAVTGLAAHLPEITKRCW